MVSYAILQNSREKTCARVSFLTKMRISTIAQETLQMADILTEI